MHQRTTPPTEPTPTDGRRRFARKALLAASALGVVTALLAPVRAGAAPAPAAPTAKAATPLAANGQLSVCGRAAL